MSRDKRADMLKTFVLGRWFPPRQKFSSSISWVDVLKDEQQGIVKFKFRQNRMEREFKFEYNDCLCWKDFNLNLTIVFIVKILIWIQRFFIRKENLFDLSLMNAFIKFTLQKINSILLSSSFC